MGSREDDDYWNVVNSYSPVCEDHNIDMNYDSFLGEWWCLECQLDDEWKEMEKHG